MELLIFVIAMLSLCAVGMAVAASADSLTIGGVTISKTTTRSGDHANNYEPITLPVGQAGTLSTRTDDDTGEATLAAEHGIETGDTVDVYWDGGMRYGVTVGTVDGNDVPLDAGSGDVYPAQDTAIVVTKQVQINCTIDGDALHIMGLQAQAADPSSTAVGHIDFQDSEGDEIDARDLAANEVQKWDIDGGATNPFTGDVITVAYASCGSATEALTLRILSLVDSTPG